MKILPTYICIVDDDRSFGKSLKRLLNVRGIMADYFESAAAFLNSVPAERTTGIVIADIHMPECDGFQLMDKMHATGYHLPVIVITGHTETDAEETAMARGAAGFLRKPFDEVSLLALIAARIRAGA